MHEIIASRLPPRVGNANFHQTSMFLSPAYPLFTFSNEENSINMAEERKRNVVHATSDIADQSSFLFVFFFFFFYLGWNPFLIGLNNTNARVPLNTFNTNLC